MAAVAPSGAPPPPPPPGKDPGHKPPPDKIDIGDTRNPKCPDCPRHLHPLSDQFKDGRWKKRCEHCRSYTNKSYAKKRDPTPTELTRPHPPLPNPTMSHAAVGLGHFASPINRRPSQLNLTATTTLAPELGRRPSRLNLSGTSGSLRRQPSTLRGGTVPRTPRGSVFDVAGVESPRTIDTGGFRRRGQESQDTSSQAVARDIITYLRRDHRTARRAGEEVDDTPHASEVLARVRGGETLEQIRAGPPVVVTTPHPVGDVNNPVNVDTSPLAFLPVSPATPSSFILRRPSTPFLRLAPRPDPGDNDDLLVYFCCVNCQINRHVYRRKRGSVDECVYDEDTVTVAEDQKKFCVKCMTEKDRRNFINSGSIEHKDCNPCRDHDDDTPVGPVPTGPTSTDHGSRWSSLVPVSRGRARTGQPNPGLRERTRERLYDNLDPPMDADSDTWPTDLVLNDEDWKLLKDFHRIIEADKMETCLRCNERWFHLKIDANNVCVSCRHLDSAKAENEPYLFSTENNADPGAMPDDLPDLTMIEEMLIARVHCFMEVRQHRGVQYKYGGHVVNFLQNTGKIYRKLPLLPKDLDVIIIQPANATEVPRINRQFRQDYRVRRSVITQWLEHLKANHPGYRHVLVDAETLGQLPEETFVDDELIRHELDSVVDPDISEPNPDDPNDDEEEPERAAVPDLLADHDEITELRRQVQGRADNPFVLHGDDFADADDIQDEIGRDPGQQPDQLPHLTVASYDLAPLSEFNQSQALLSLAFPSLFPNGLAEYVTPRIRGIKYPLFVRHLFLYKDGRFQRHPRFRYLIYNTIMRKQVNSRAGFFVNKMAQQHNALSLDDLRKAFEDDSPESHAILNSITRYAGSLQGTRPFWNGKRHGLESMVTQLGCPHVFFTASYADYHWHSLAKHMPREMYDRWLASSPSERLRISRVFVRDYPAIVAYHFHRRLDVFRATVLNKKLCIKDYWNRYEWQARGTSHNHGLYWIDGAPENDRLRTMSEDLREVFVKFWGIHVSAYNPDPGEEKRVWEDRSPMSLHPDDIENKGALLSRLLNWFQHHVHSKHYCLRINKHTQDEECRFDMPLRLREAPALEIPIGRTFEKFRPIRNDTMLNNYNRLITMAWMANTDIAPCTSKRGVIEYVVKYAAKAEKQSSSYKEMANLLMGRLNPNRPFQSLVERLMNLLLKERDVSAQEVCHMLLQIPLINTSRTVINVDMRPEVAQGDLFFAPGDGEEPRKGKSILEKYKERLQNPPSNATADEIDVLRELTYLEFLRSWQHTRPYRVRPRAPERVVNFFPHYTSDQVEDYCRSKLMLHKSFETIDELLRFPDQTCHNFFEAWEYFKDQRVQGDRGPIPRDGFDRYDDDEDEEEESIHEDTQADTPDDVDASWAELARQLPVCGADFDEPDRLGDRDMDRAARWDDRVGNFVVNPDFWEHMKVDYPAEELSIETSGGVNDLVGKQAVLYWRVMDHKAQTDFGLNPPPLHLQVDGPGGTGKSFTVKVLCRDLKRNAESNGGIDPVLRAAPTGVAALGVIGKTLHTLLRLPTGQDLESLPVTTLQSMQAAFRGKEYLIVDEKSMIGLRQLSWIDQRLRQIFPHNRVDFGGMSIILMGDFYQLPPVGQRALYNTATVTNLHEINGQRLYRLFMPTVKMDVIMRQQGDDQAPFRDALGRIRINKVTIADWRLLTTRVKSEVPIKELPRFKNAPRLYANRDDVRLYNHQNMRDLNTPVIAIKAVHTGIGAELADTQTAGNLQKLFFASINSRIMLTYNLWTERHLVNGSFGFIRDFIWATGVDDPRNTMPLAILVAFDNYKDDAPYFTEHNGEHLVPIFPEKRSWTQPGGVTCSRKQFPLVIAYAITIHKSQGISLDEGVLNVSKKEFAPGLTYVGISRIRTLQGLLFEEPFGIERFKGPKNPSKILKMRAEDELRRQRHEINVWPPLAQDDTQTNLQQPVSFDLPIRSSSAAGFRSSNYGSSDVLFGGDNEGSSEQNLDSDPVGVDTTVVATTIATVRATTTTATTTTAATTAVGTTLPVELYPEYDNNEAPFSQSAAYFECTRCHIVRDRKRRIRPDRDVCEYCHHRIPDNFRFQWCMAHSGEAIQTSYTNVDSDGYEIEYPTCARCRGE